MLSDNFSATKDASLAIVTPVGLAHAARALTLALDAAAGKAPAHAASDGHNAALNVVARPQSLADEAHRQLLLQLDMGLWKAGDKLPPEKALADSLGVSRPIVREALARLKADGRIESRQGSRAFVAERSKLAAFRLAERAADAGDAAAGNAADVAERELLELRQIVEAGAAELAASRRTAVDLAAIRAALADMGDALAARSDGSDADDRFHNAIAAATHNAQIGRFVEFLGAQFSASRKVTWDHTGYAVGIAEVGHGDHSAILQAIDGQDAPRAKALAQAHVQRALDRVLARLAVRGTAAGNDGANEGAQHNAAGGA